jgi:S-adenosylmethionine:tRNA ribosyltransferase-isomerase
VRTQLFQYDLPADRIAQYPSDRREDAKLLHLNRASGEIAVGATIVDLANDVREGDVWVVNNTRVRRARILARKASGGRVELLILSVEDTTARAMYRASKPLKSGQTLLTEGGEHEIRVTANEGGGIVQVDLGSDAEQRVEELGQVPLPPYIERSPEPSDANRYQTVYARHLGAVAAPTAGLHFTPDLMTQMEVRGARFAEVTLHVGPGTFRPIRCDDVTDHVLHSEEFAISDEAAELIASATRVVAVGTTCVRTLEAAARESGIVEPGSGETDLYITPGFDFRVVDALLTNFHLPGSSLLVLVAAFVGYEPTMAAYKKALESDFHMYSYGDAMLIS